MGLFRKAHRGQRRRIGGKVMNGVIALAIATSMAIALAGCGAGHSTPRPPATVTVTASPQATSTTSPAASSVSAAATNERLFADGMAPSIPVAPSRCGRRCTNARLRPVRACFRGCLVCCGATFSR